MRKMGLVAVVLIISFVGCAIYRSNLAIRAQTELVGMTKKQLFSCAGVPIRQEQVDDLEFLTYKHYCEATFILKDGIVQKINYQGRTGGGLLAEDKECAFVVEKCLKP